MQTNVQAICLTPADAAHYIGLSASTLAKKRMDGTGPEYLKLGKRKVAYHRDALDKWINSKVCNNTGQTQ